MTTTTATFRPGDMAVKRRGGGARDFFGTIEDTHRERGILLVDRRLTPPRGAWFAPGELRLVRRVAGDEREGIAMD